MRYSVEIHFDRESGERIRQMIAAVGEQLGVGVLNEIESRPHVSLAVLEDVDPAVLSGIVERWAAGRRGFGMALSAVGSFPGDTGVIFVAPAMSPELLEMHESVYAALCAAGLHVEDYYVPGKWVPHCTVCMNAPRERMEGIIEFVRRSAVFGAVRVVSVSVVEFWPACEVGTFQLVG
jgi:2'-5' RNA ligase